MKGVTVVIRVDDYDDNSLDDHGQPKFSDNVVYREIETKGLENGQEVRHAITSIFDMLDPEAIAKIGTWVDSYKEKKTKGDDDEV